MIIPSCCIIKGMEARQQEATELVAHKEQTWEVQTEETTLIEHSENTTINELLGNFPDLRPHIEGDRSILQDIREGYQKDPLCIKLLENIEQHKKFEVEDDFLYTCNHADNNVLYIPSAIIKK